MKGFIVGVLAIVLVLLTAVTASAQYSYLSPVNPGSLAYTTTTCSGCCYPTQAAYAYTVAYPAAYPACAYPILRVRRAARPVVVAAPLAAQPIIATPISTAPIIQPMPTVVARPVVVCPTWP